MEVTDLSAKAGRTRAALLDAVERLLGAGADPGSAAVAAEARVATGTFYRYFSDRDDALAAAFARRLDDLIDGVEAALDPARVLDVGVAAVLDEVVDRVADGYAESGPVIAAALARLRASEPIRGVYRSRHSRATTVLATFLRRVDRAGMVAVEDVGATAVAVVVLVEGLNHPALRTDPQGAVRRRVAVGLRAVVGVPSDAERNVPITGGDV